MRNILIIKLVVFASVIAIISIFSCSKDNGSSATCSDGILNGNELGIDCGGDCGSCPTCTDGIQNGNETGVDCGGTCNACLDLVPKLLGLWEITGLTLDGADGFQVAGFEALFYKFSQNGQFESFNHRTNGQNNLTQGTFSVNNTVGTLTTVIGNTTSIFNITFADNNTRFNLIQQGQNITVAARKISDNLCQGVNCNSGTCIYGYCNCPSGIEGDNCEVTRGPAGGIVVYDKGFVSNGWRYIEVYPELQAAKVIGCPNTAGKFGVDGYGAGANNTVSLSIFCQNTSNHAANTALGLSLNGFDDWFIPSRIELVAIYNFNKYLLDYPSSSVSYDIHTSLFNGTEDHNWLRFKQSIYEGNISSGNVSRKYFVIRYF